MTDVDQLEDVVYGYKDGMGLVMDVFTSRDPRVDAGVIVAVSGGWSTDLARRRNLLNDPEEWGILPRCLLDAGYVVFAVAHSTRPRYTIEELRPDLPRAVRFIRHNAGRFHIDPGRLGIVGGSSGGHVSLMTALSPPALIADADDPVDRESSQVQAVAAYFPPTDLLNYGETGVTMLELHGARRASSLGCQRFDDEAGRLERITDPDQFRQCLRENSPITHVHADNPPVLLIHGDGDELVPLSQSETLRGSLVEKGVVNRLLVLEGHGHAWPPLGNGQQDVLDWFGRHLGPERRPLSG
jgi:acetyl esterase/lipase